MRSQTLLKLLLTVTVLLAPLHAGVLAGDTVNLTYYYPDSSSVWLDYGNIVVPNSYGNVEGKVTIQVNDSSIVATFLNTNNFSGAAFNGWVLTDLTSAPITGVTINPSSNLAGFTASNLSFDSSHVTVDWQGLSFDSSTVLQLDLNAGPAVPEPASSALIGLGITGLAIVRRRRARVN